MRELQLSRGPEQRTAGAPVTTLPAYEDAVNAVSVRLLEQAFLPVTPEYMRAIRPQAEQYVQQNAGPSAGGIPPAEAARNRARNQGMVDFAQGYYESTGAPDWATREVVESLGGEVEDPVAGGNPGFGAEEELTPEERELNEWRESVAREGAAEDARYGRGRDADLEARRDAVPQVRSVPRAGVAVFRTDGSNATADSISASGAANAMYGDGAVPGDLDPWQWRTQTPGYTPRFQSPEGHTGPRPRTSLGPPAPGVHGQVMVPYSPPVPYAQRRAGVPIGQARITDPLIAPELMPAIQDSFDAERQLAERAERRAREDRFHASTPQREARIQRMASQAGITYAEAAALVDGARATVRPAVPTNQEAGGAGNLPGIAGPPVASGPNQRDASGIPMTGAERAAEFAPLRAKVREARMADQASRRARVSQQARLAGGQPTGGPGGTRAAVEWMNEGWGRTDELIQRLGQEGLSDWERAAIMQQLSPRADMQNPTPLGVEAVGAANAMRNLNSATLAGMNPLQQEALRRQAELQELNLPTDQRVALSIRRQEPMGTGLSAGPVQTEWNRVGMFRGEGAFRRTMEGWGYTPRQIDEWIDSRSGGGPQGPPAPPDAAPGMDGNGAFF